MTGVKLEPVFAKPTLAEVIENLGETPRFSATTLAKAAKVTDMRQDGTYPRVFWMPAGTTGNPYRVQLGPRDEDGVVWISCTCPHGKHTPLDKTGCYHAARALYEGALKGMSDSE